MSRRRAPIAIVGLGCRFAGAADLPAFWADVLAGRDPAAGGPAPGVEPGPSLVLDAARQALADAGIDPEGLLPARGDLVLLRRGRPLAQVVGLLADPRAGSTAADREGPGLGRSGASFVVDSAGASTLVALDLGCRALRDRRADLALVVGVHVPAGDEGDGLAPGEGVGAVVLKRLADAERDGDRVYAVVRSVGLAGAGPGARAIRRAHRAAGVDPATVALVEADGAGFPAARRAELRALAAAMPARPGGPRVLGAVAPPFGREAPAAGIAGLIKAALALHHRLLPPTPGAEAPGRRVAAAGFERLAAPRPWIHGDPAAPRRAGVNALGPAGLGAHTLLEEHPASDEGPGDGALTGWDTEALLLSADDRPGLADRARRLADRLRRRGDLPLRDVAFTLNTGGGAGAGAVRLGLVGGGHAELADRLELAAAALDDPARDQLRDARGIYFWERSADRRGRLAFLFPGQGAQYPGMLADLCLRFPEARAVLDRADRIALESGDPTPPSAHLYGPGAGAAGLWDTDTAINAVLSTQWALFQVLRRLGLRPDAVVGHSSGELPALAAAGVFEPAGAAGSPDGPGSTPELEAALGRLATVFRGLEAGGEIPRARLLAVAAPRERVEALAAGLGGRAAVAIDNCPHQVVVAAPPDEADRLLEALRGAGLLAEELPFARAYHTPAFGRVVGPLDAFYRGLGLRPPATPIYSCATAARMPDDPREILPLAVGQWARPVRFRETIEAMHADGFREFVDVGARGNLCGYVEDTLRGRPAFAVAASLPRRSSTMQLNHLVASLFARGVPLDPAYLYLRRRARRVDLESSAPVERTTIPLDLGATGPPPEPPPRCRCHAAAPGPDPEVVAAPPAEPHRQVEPAGPELAGAEDEGVLAYLGVMDEFLRTQGEVMRAYLAAPARVDAAATEAVEERTPGPWVGTVLDLVPGRSLVARRGLEGGRDPVAVHHTLGGRRVSAVDPERLGLPVLPFAVMAEMVAQAGRLLAPPGAHFEGLAEVRAHRWVPFDAETPAVELRGAAEGPGAAAVRVAIHTVGPGGAAGAKPVFEGVARFGAAPPGPRAAALAEPAGGEPSRFTANELYEDQWLFHGPPFRALARTGRWGPGGMAGTLRVLPLGPLLDGPAAAPFLIDPVCLDAFTHLLGCWGLNALEQGHVIYPLGMGALTVRGPRPAEGAEVACRIAVRELDHFRVRVDAELVRPDGQVWMEIRGWEDWRFHWPAACRDVFRAPDRVLIGADLPLPGTDPRGLRAVWLEPPADLGRPIWRDVLEAIQLAPAEAAACRALPELGDRRTHRLWGRVAAKEAARRLWLAAGGAPRFPADLEIAPDDRGRPVLRDRARPGAADLPAVSIAHTGGVAVGLASADPGDRLGVDVEPVLDRPAGFEALAFTGPERDRLGAWPGGLGRPEAIARLWCAKEAAAKATGLGFQGNPALAEVAAVRPDGQDVVVRLSGPLAEAWAGPPTLIVHTARRGDHAWAWTRGEGA